MPSSSYAAVDALGTARSEVTLRDFMKHPYGNMMIASELKTGRVFEKSAPPRDQLFVWLGELVGLSPEVL